jgi:hypothetical protein
MSCGPFDHFSNLSSSKAFELSSAPCRRNEGLMGDDARTSRSAEVSKRLWYNFGRVHLTLPVTTAMKLKSPTMCGVSAGLLEAKMTTLRKALLSLLVVVGALLVLLIGLLFYFRLTSERVSG